MRLFKIFTRMPSIDHPVLGNLKLCRGKKGPYWMHDAYKDDEVALSIETIDEQPPMAEQVAFYERIVGDLDATFARVASHVVPRYEKLLRRSFPTNWREAFTFSGMGIPLDGSEDQPWDLSFTLETDNLGYLFTCYFERGQLIGVTVDT